MAVPDKFRLSGDTFNPRRVQSPGELTDPEAILIDLRATLAALDELPPEMEATVLRQFAARWDSSVGDRASKPWSRWSMLVGALALFVAGAGLDFEIQTVSHTVGHTAKSSSVSVLLQPDGRRSHANVAVAEPVVTVAYRSLQAYLTGQPHIVALGYRVEKVGRVGRFIQVTYREG